MASTLDPKAIPALTGSPTTETSPGDLTVYLKIDLGIAGQQPMTAVYLPNRMQVGSELDVILYFHGHKKDKPAMTIQEYFKDPRSKLREAIGQSSRKGFVFVAPTLGVTADFGALKDAADAEAFLSQVMNGVFEHVDATYAQGIPNFRKTPAVKRLILAAHSGGGVAMRTL